MIRERKTCHDSVDHIYSAEWTTLIATCLLQSLFFLNPGCCMHFRESKYIMYVNLGVYELHISCVRHIHLVLSCNTLLL